MAQTGIWRAALFASVAGGIVVAPALAQAAGDGIEEVVVTATHRAEALSKVPASITAFTSARMDQLDVKSVKDLVPFTPGLSYDSGTDTFSIRGIHSNAGAATTGIYIDDTPIQLRSLGFNSDGALPAVFDLSRVEVLRGPQGTLYGAGSEGGTIRFITPQPNLNSYHVYAKSEFSTTEHGDPSEEGGLALGGPIVPGKLGFRISGWMRHDGGWINHVDYMNGNSIEKNSNYVDTYVVHAALGWKAAPGLLITPSVYVQNRIANNNNLYWVGLSNPGAGVFNNATPERMANKDFFILPSLRIQYDLGQFLGGSELVSNSSYFYRHQRLQGYSGSLYNLSYFQQLENYGMDPNGNTCPGGLCATNPQPLLLANTINLPGFGPYLSINRITNFQQNVDQEVRLQSTDAKSSLSWIVGLFYSSNRQQSVEEINDPQLPQLTQYLWGEDMLTAWGANLLPNGDDYINHTTGHDSQTAVFAHADYHVTDKLKVQAGLRVAQTHFDFTNFSDGPQNFGPIPPQSGKKDETPVTPMGGVTYQINSDDMAYATVSKGYRIGGANPPFPAQACAADLATMGVSSVPSTYNSDSVISYEVGSKDHFANHRVQLSGSLFYLNWDNIQQANYLPSCGFQYTTNLGTAASAGFDMDGQVLVTDALSLNFSVGYTDAHYTSSSRTGPAAGAPVLASKGDMLPGSPWNFALGAQYNTQLMGLESYFRADYEYESKEIGRTPAQDPITTSYDPALVNNPATNLVSLRAGTIIGDLDVALFVDNLLDSHPQLDLQHQDQYTLLYEASTLRPRTIGITAIYRY